MKSLASQAELPLSNNQPSVLEGKIVTMQPAQTSERAWSIHQQRVFSHFTHGTTSAIVKAVAGSGKTTTIVEASNRISEPMLMLAFNRLIANELKGRVKSHVTVATFHSIGMKAFTAFLGKRITVDDRKVDGLLKCNLAPADNELYFSFVSKLVGLGKSAGMRFLMPDVEIEWLKLCEHFDHYPESETANLSRGIQIAQAVLADSIEMAMEGVIDFDDMLFMPLIKNVRFDQFPIVVIDEAQDTNGVQRALLKRMIQQPNGRLIAVGDPKQAIYGFRGADSSAMQKIAEEFGCIELGLTISYRCAKAVVRYSQEIVPYIEASPTAPEGSVTFNPMVEDASGKLIPQPFRPIDAILCRNTAPLVTKAYSLIAQGVGCRILGREIGKGLIKLIESMKAKGIDALEIKLAEYCRKEVAKFVAKDEGPKAEALQDRVACITTCIKALDQNNRTVPQLCRNIDSLFTDNGNGMLTLCTIHKSKGLEWERVYILDAAKLMPSRWAKKPWQKEQESNLCYVAYTRAKLELAFIESPEK